MKATLHAVSLSLLGITQVWGAHPSRGLWVGEVALNAVNEATGAVGDSNTYEFTDPAEVTPTSDAAYLRLILHVNGAGQVHLLKSVAVVDTETAEGGSSDLLLLTDPALYPNYPGIAKRIASAFFDFGDPLAVRAVDQLIDTATETAVSSVLAGSATLETDVSTAVSEILDQAAVGTAYLDRGSGASSFLTDDFFSLENVQSIADAVAAEIEAGATAADFAYTADPYAPFAIDPLGGNFAVVVAKAENLRDSSFYGDTRGIDAIVNIVTEAAVAAEAASASGLSVMQAQAQIAAEAAWHNAADINQDYNRFLAGTAFTEVPSIILDLAVETAITAEGEGQDESEIMNTVKDVLLANTPGYTDAELIRAASLWGDPRAVWALDYLVDTTSATAAAQVLVSTDSASLTNLVSAALNNAFEAVDSAPVFALSPSETYLEYVGGTDFSDAATDAASTASEEASFQYNAGVTDEDDLTILTRRAVSKALIGARNAAASLPMHEVLLSGSLEADAVIAGEIHLPALAPTNPFLHRLHPDHGEGIAVTRELTLTVDPDDDSDGSYGVTRLTGTYREEIFGLHKALGNSQDIGLLTEGSFSLNRLTLVDTLNF
ncbi:hypothetical protein [Coraliomargarita parva]|uniref:hypothetical protein n=1 Tax=Coraliomargarita parva TaxID=3014050 RepID=UPI0022B476C9|nr:hypothetical protein [Coraliomargarita parva]